MSDLGFPRIAHVTAWIVLLCFVSTANAEIRNEAQIHDVSEICEEYLDYLAGGHPEASDECRPIESLLIDGADLEFGQFLEHFESEANPNSALSYLIQGLSAYLIGAAVEAFYFLDEADRAIFSGFQSIGDVERATRLCCTNPVRDSSRESSVVAGAYEQTDTPNLQDPELASLQ